MRKGRKEAGIPKNQRKADVAKDWRIRGWGMTEMNEEIRKANRQLYHALPMAGLLFSV